MPDHVLFKRMFELGAQLKGAPLTKLEKRDLDVCFSHASGSAFQRAITALSEVLNTNPSLIFERSGALDREGDLLRRLVSAADAWEGNTLEDVQ